MVDSIGLNKINSVPKTKPVSYKKTKKSKRDSEEDKQNSKGNTEEKKRIGINVDERC
ncbi:MAG: hypothetical protein QNK31_00495 [Porticoccus sp.]|nr:hypothetical protein [Porticoccus sp.]